MFSPLTSAGAGLLRTLYIEENPEIKISVLWVGTFLYAQLLTIIEQMFHGFFIISTKANRWFKYECRMNIIKKLHLILKSK